VGQKTHPYGFRLVYNKTWHSRWYAEKDYAKLLKEDVDLREGIKERLAHAGVSEVDIERAADKLRVTIYTSRPGIIIGRKGAEVDKLRDDLQKQVGREVHINIQEITRPELDAQLVAQNVAHQLTRRIAFRRAMRKAMESAFRFGAKGAKIMIAGRLGGHEIARTEWYQDGRLPLHTLKADIDYGFTEAHTTYGVIGVKVWIYKGDLDPGEKVDWRSQGDAPPRPRRPRPERRPQA
jgi:small subunit ribosomal protein S3